MLTKLIPALITLVLAMGTALPLTTHAAPLTNTRHAPAAAQLTADFHWTCSTTTPEGWVRTVALTYPNHYCGTNVAFGIERLTPGWAGWTCSGKIPEGWVNTAALTYPTPSCGTFVSWAIEPLTPGWEGWTCQGKTPDGWIITSTRIGHHSCGGGGIRAYYIKPL